MAATWLPFYLSLCDSSGVGSTLLDNTFALI
jgi:hypothetical protein